MFTGLIEEVGKVKSISHKSGGISIDVEAIKILEGTKIGDSIAINGVCLTVVQLYENGFSFDVSQETLSRSNLRNSKVGDYLNLERALRVSDRLGGHIGQGHVDSIGKITGITPYGEHTEFKIQIPDEYKHLIVEKGSIAIDGISLTINSIENSTISINIIPHTIENTNLKYRKVGDSVNIEFDIIGKYVWSMLERTGLSNKRDSLENLLSRF